MHVNEDFVYTTCFVTRPIGCGFSAPLKNEQTLETDKYLSF